MSENLTELLAVRITKTMNAGLEHKARRLGLRVQDLVRVWIAERLFDAPTTLVDPAVEYETEPAT